MSGVSVQSFKSYTLSVMTKPKFTIKTKFMSWSKPPLITAARTPLKSTESQQPGNHRFTLGFVWEPFG